MAWNVTICSAPALLKLNKSRRDLPLVGVASSPPAPPPPLPPPPPGLPRDIESVGLCGGSPKRQFCSAFDQQDEILEDDVLMVGDGIHQNEKKRRLTMDQVRFLEHSFDTENKLEPERKLQIAKQLGLQPRQVAVWFQNRRARSKSKQLERDFNDLKAKYDAISEENDKLHVEVARLTTLLQSPNNDAKAQASGSSSGMASLGVKIEVEVSTSGSGGAPHVISSHDLSTSILDSPKSEVFDSSTSPSGGISSVMSLPSLISPTAAAAAAAAAVIAATKVAETSSKIVESTTNDAATTVLSSTTTTTTTATEDVLITNMTTATTTTAATSSSTSSTYNPLLVQQLSLCKLQDGYLTEDYNLIFAQWPDVNVTGGHLLQNLNHDSNLFIAQYWDDPSSILDPWYDCNS